MATKHTPGPWHIGKRAADRAIYSESSEIAKMLDFFHEADEALANARLIAAAPDMLEALQYIVNWTPDKWNPEKARDLAHAAIAKATGNSDKITD